MSRKGSCSLPVGSPRLRGARRNEELYHETPLAERLPVRFSSSFSLFRCAVIDAGGGLDRILVPPRAAHLYQKAARKNTAYPLFMKLHPSCLFFKLRAEAETDKTQLKPGKTRAKA